MGESNGENEDVPSGADLLGLMYWMDEDGLSMTDLENRLVLDANSDHDHLETLRQAGYLKKEGEKYYCDTKGAQYCRGIRDTGGGWRVSVANVYDNNIIEAKVAEIAERTNERAQFLIEGDDQKGVYTHCAAGTNAVPTDALSEKLFPFHLRAAGVALLLKYTPEFADAISPSFIEHVNGSVGQESSAETEYTYSDGVTYTFDESTGVHAMAVPVFDDRSVPFGAVEVSGPSDHFNENQRQQEIPEILNAAASELSDTVNLYPDV